MKGKNELRGLKTGVEVGQMYVDTRDGEILRITEIETEGNGVYYTCLYNEGRMMNLENRFFTNYNMGYLRTLTSLEQALYGIE